MKKHIRRSKKHLTALGVTLTVNPYKNLMFEVLFTLLDPTHLYKNIRKNWFTEKTEL